MDKVTRITRTCRKAKSGGANMPQLEQIIAVYMATVSVIAWLVTVIDKHRAKKHRWRIPEATLLWIAAAGGSIAMLVTMRVIRHKTAKRKFMWGIPAIIALQIAAIAGVIYLVYVR